MIQDWRDSGLEGFRTGGIQDWRDICKEGYRKEGIKERSVQDRRVAEQRDAGWERYRKMGCRTGGMLN